MNTRTFNDITFNQALTRARLREAAEIKAAIEGKKIDKTVDLYKMLDNKIRDNMAKAFR